MDAPFEQENSGCLAADISAYIDGELTFEREEALEKHLAVCGVCSEELNAQKSLLQALDLSFDKKDIELPAAFTRTVVANAESRVSGLRKHDERLNAIFISAALFLFVLFTLGTDAERSLGIVAGVGEKAVAFIGWLSHFLFDIALGVIVIFRFLAAQFFSGAVAPLVLAALGMFVLSALVLARFRHSRT